MTAIDAAEVAELGNAARRYLGDLCERRPIDADSLPDELAKLAELGWTWIVYEEGTAGNREMADAIRVVFAAAGAHPTGLPLLELVVANPVLGSMLGETADGSLASALAGDAYLPLAFVPPPSTRPRTSPWDQLDGSSGRFSGSKTLVAYADAADGFLAAATIDSTPCIALIPAGQDGIELDLLTSPDRLQHSHTVHFDSVDGQVLLSGDSARRAMESVVQLAQLAVVAELGGLARSSVELSVAYALDRLQFGRPIGSFQAVKHLLADAWAEAYAIEACAVRLAHSISSATTSPGDAKRARLHASIAARRATEIALQVHGGIGFTLECQLSWAFHRAASLWASWGDPAQLRQELGRSALETAAARG